MVYSWFLYPLATLGLEQLLRVGQLAVRERCVQLGKAQDDFHAELSALVSAKILSTEDENRWLALGRLCDGRDFLAGVTLLDPGQAIGTLRLITDRINGLF